MYVEFYPYDFYLTNKRPMSAIGRAYKELKEIKILPENIATIPLEHLYQNTENFNVLHSLDKARKKDYSQQQWNKLYADLVSNKYSNGIPIFCDGSVSGQVAGCGIWSPLFQLSSRLSDGISIYTAELYAIYYSIVYIKNQPGEFVLYTDSLSSLQSLKDAHPPDHYMTIKIKQTLHDIPDNKLILEWVPSHVGIHGNECPDKLANDSHKLKVTSHIPFAKKEIRKLINTHYQKRRESYLTSDLKKLKCINRTQAVI